MAEGTDETTTDNAVTITLIQMNCVLGKPKDNFSRAAALIAEARKRGSDLAVLPELWSTGYDLENAGKHASRLTGRSRSTSWFNRFAALVNSNPISRPPREKSSENSSLLSIAASTRNIRYPSSEGNRSMNSSSAISRLPCSMEFFNAPTNRTSNTSPLSSV